MSFGPKDSLPASLQWGAQREDAAVQDTQEVRVVEAGATGDTLNVVRAEDERIVAAQQRGDDGHNPCSATLAVAPRSSAFRFIVGRQVDVSAIELMVEIATGTVGAGSFWVALFDGTVDEPTTWRRNFGSFPAGKVGEAKWVNCYLAFSGDTIETLYPGSYYWIAICARDPDPGASTPDADAWQGTALWVRKIVHAGITGRLVIDNTGDAIPPYAGGGYDAYDNLHHPWFKLYERSIIYDVPVAPGASVPSVGETAVMERIQGQHPRRQITGGALRTSGKAGVVRSGVGGGNTAAGDPHHQLLSAVHDDTEGAAPTAGDLIIADETPVWRALASPGAQYRLLMTGAGPGYLPQWAALPGSDTQVLFNDAGALEVASGLVWLKATGRFGVGCTNPEFFFEVSRDTLNQACFSTFNSAYQYYRPQLLLRRARNSRAVPQAVLSGDELGDIAWHGYDGTAFQAGAGIEVFTTEDWDGTHRGVYLRCRVVPTGSTTMRTLLKLENCALTIGEGLAGVDYALVFDGESSDGTLTWMEDEGYWKTSHPLRICDAYTLPSTDGAAGNVLTAHANGVPTWEPSAAATSAPVGSVVSWLKSLIGTPALPSGWVECNGQTISDASSPYNGVAIPNLNASGGGTQRFLRGATTSGGTGGAESHTHSGGSHQHGAGTLATDGHSSANTTAPVGGATLLTGPTGGHSISGSTQSGSASTGSAGTVPSYYEVVWIMRIR